MITGGSGSGISGDYGPGVQTGVADTSNGGFIVPVAGTVSDLTFLEDLGGAAGDYTITIFRAPGIAGTGTATLLSCRSSVAAIAQRSCTDHVNSVVFAQDDKLIFHLIQNGGGTRVVHWAVKFTPS